MHKIPFGAHKGKFWSDVSIPNSYLFYLIRPDSNLEVKYADLVKRELIERGLKIPGVLIRTRTLNTASIRCIDAFIKREDKSKGIHAWLLNEAKMALEKGEPLEPNNKKIKYNGIVFEFYYSSTYPMLVTVHMAVDEKQI